ncbi:MAG: holo-ACP synthase [Candidatus Binatia bacterium]
MVVGVGIDMVEVERLKRALENPKSGRKFRDRVYTEKEIEYCEGKKRGKYESYAGRFAAKEATMKALGSGWGSRVTWLDIETLPALGGKPEVCLYHKTSEFARELGVQHLSVSITHTKNLAMACVVAHKE